LQFWVKVIEMFEVRANHKQVEKFFVLNIELLYLRARLRMEDSKPQRGLLSRFDLLGQRFCSDDEFIGDGVCRASQCHPAFGAFARFGGRHIGMHRTSIELRNSIGGREADFLRECFSPCKISPQQQTEPGEEKNIFFHHPMICSLQPLQFDGAAMKLLSWIHPRVGALNLRKKSASPVDSFVFGVVRLKHSPQQNISAVFVVSQF
jgi:hypothetical protein